MFFYVKYFDEYRLSAYPGLVETALHNEYNLLGEISLFMYSCKYNYVLEVIQKLFDIQLVHEKLVDSIMILNQYTTPEKDKKSCPKFKVESAVLDEYNIYRNLQNQYMNWNYPKTPITPKKCTS
jgi:hypothetical protein